MTAPAVLDEVPATVSANIPDDVVAEETHLKDLSVGEDALLASDQPDKENVFVGHHDGGVSNQSESAIIMDDDELFKDDDEQDDDDGFVPRGEGVKYTSTKEAGLKPKPLKQGNTSTAATSKTHGSSDSDATPATEKPKDAKGKKKNVKTAK